MFIVAKYRDGLVFKEETMCIILTMFLFENSIITDSTGSVVQLSRVYTTVIFLFLLKVRNYYFCVFGRDLGEG